MLLQNSGGIGIALSLRARTFRSKAALEAIAKASEERIPNIALYNYPSFSGAFSALFAHLFHSHLNLPCLILPFSSVEPFRVEDLNVQGLEKCYFFDFLGPKGFAVDLCQKSPCQVVGFDHRKSSVSKIPSSKDCPENLKFILDIEKSSSNAVYEYFSHKLTDANSLNGKTESLLHPQDQDRIETVLKYIEDRDLCRWKLPEIKSFNIGLSEWRLKLNCITNPYMYEQNSLVDIKVELPLDMERALSINSSRLPWKDSNKLKNRELLKISSMDLIFKGNSYLSSCQHAASNLLKLNKVFKVRLGRGFYGECLGVTAEGNSSLTDEIGRQLSKKSAEAGLRPIGAVIYMQRNNLKMCLRSTDSAIDTSEVAKAYGGGGSPRSSSFIIRMDEYNQWLSVNSS